MNGNSRHLPVTLILLAGGKGTRMEGQDKGLLDINGKSAIEQLIIRFSDQAAQIRISANRNIEKYREFGLPVINDEFPGFQGPLCGILSASRNMTTDYIMTIPCDMPNIPADIVRHMADFLVTGNKTACYIYDGKRQQPLLSLFHKKWLAVLEKEFVAGLRKAMTWIDIIEASRIDMDMSEQEAVNINAAQDY